MLEPAEVQRWERLTAAMIRKAGQDDPEVFAQVVAIVDSLKPQLVEAAAQLRRPLEVQGLHWDHRYSWADIGRTLGVTRSAAAQRWG